MGLFRGIIILGIVFALWYYSDSVRGGLPSDFNIEALREFKSYAPDQYEGMLAEARAFELERNKSSDLTKLAYHAAKCLEYMGELSMRLPNDARAREKLERIIQQTEYIFQRDMTSGYELCPHPFPFRQYYFRNSSVAPTLV